MELSRCCLSRVADALYWISRYLERAEHTARARSTSRLDLGLDRAADVRSRWRSSGSYASLGLAGRPTRRAVRASLRRAALVFDLANRNSVAGLRHRGARERAPGPRRDQLRHVGAAQRAVPARAGRCATTASGRRGRTTSRASIIEGVHLFQGITDATMGHGEGWQYLQVGPLPRARRRRRRRCSIASSATRRVPTAAGRRSIRPTGSALLRSCSALEGVLPPLHGGRAAGAGRRVPAAQRGVPAVGPVRGRARRGGAARASRSYSGRPRGGRAERLAGRLRASLDYGQVDEILSDDPHAYLDGISRQCAQIHSAAVPELHRVPDRVGAAGVMRR